ncbi:MAG: helix-hairpin-helix domain-containing protein, partial [Eubacteriales bacterium]
ADIFDEIEMLLKGDYAAAEKSLKAKMYAASEQMRFEAAAKYRDSIRNLERLSTHQKIKSTPGMQKDVFGFYETDTHSALAVLLVRDGVIIDKNVILMGADEIADEETLADLLLRYYHNPETIPKEISLSFALDAETESTVTDILSEKSGHAVLLHTPQKGKNKELCAMAVENAMEAIRTKAKQEENDSSLLVRLAQVLELEVLPERIESYDISNSGESDIYCGMIVIENGRFKKSDYRAFAIKSTDGIDDYGSMREALTRRFAHLTDSSDTSALALPPDLILLDGGVGHVSTVKEAARSAGVDIPIFGMVKDQYHKTRTITDGENEISIAKDQLLFTFIYKIQEEVHRFTFSKMDAARRKRMRKMELTNVKGVGEAKAKAIYETFKTTAALKAASVDEICRVKGITPTLAQSIKDYLEENA